MIPRNEACARDADDQLWDKLRGEFDEIAADDLDVDMRDDFTAQTDYHDDVRIHAHTLTSRHA